MVDANNDVCRTGNPYVFAGCRIGADIANEKLAEQITDALERIDESRARKGKFVKDKVLGKVNAGFDDDEFEIAFFLAFTGKQKVESRDDSLPAVGASDGKGFDAYVDGHRAEFKTVSKNTASATYDRLRGANKQHVDRVYVMVRDGVEKQNVEAGRRNFSGNRDNPALQYWQVIDGGAGWGSPFQSINQPL